MHNSPHLVRITAVATGIAAVLAFGQAHGAAFQLKENSAKGLGRAFAGAASAPDDAAIIVNNPAGMRQLDGRQFQVDVSAISFSAKYRGEGGNHVGPTGPGTGTAISGGNGGDAGMIAPVPAAYFHLPFGENDNMHLGASLSVPFGFKTEYDRDWVGRYHGVKTELQAVDVGLAFSYDVNPYVSFGASVFAERLDVDLTSAMDLGAALYGVVPGFVPGGADGYNRIKGNNTEVGFTLGSLFSIDENTHIGFTYRSEVEHKISDGTARFTADGTAGTQALAVLRTQGLFVDSKGRATITLPASASASFTHRINDQWSIMADVTRTAWSKFDRVLVDLDSGQQLPLEFHYRDTTFASIGADYRLSDTVTLRGGLAYDQTPTTSAHRDVRVPDASRKWVSLGMSWTPSERAEYNFGYTHLFTSDPTIDLTSAYGSTLAGSYDVVGDVLAASVNYKF
ncbi:outer membrane protein transport protein [Stenotrophomonas sp. MMGLT7]|uniref:outer membrane protein transport protein n=1 Tax=Stenotrophomonas sp. MMGLT7 TaxID=2901227 RepID=UPI001E37FA35|nr:outer membrane protein transport protein [Stenotrophomonas sp. MMGLT7]MCD7097786.1 outer membrane protein transport protein [Stenotrophomonas sp. MMGLT7]